MIWNRTGDPYCLFLTFEVTQACHHPTNGRIEDGSRLNRFSRGERGRESEPSQRLVLRHKG